MKNIAIICLTIFVLTLGNLGAAFALQLAFFDIAIPFAILALSIVYFFKSKGGMTSRYLDMSIQGQTGIRMEQQAYVSGRSYILIGSILYFVFILGLTLVVYREYIFT